MGLGVTPSRAVGPRPLAIPGRGPQPLRITRPQESASVLKTAAIMQRARTRHPLPSMLKQQGEPTVRYLAEMCTKLAEKLEHDATIERERARRYLEAADARAAEKRTKREAPIRARYAKSRLILKHS